MAKKQCPIERNGGIFRKMLNEIEARQRSDTEFKTMVIRKLNEVTENYQKLQGNYEDLLQTTSA